MRKSLYLISIFCTQKFKLYYLTYVKTSVESGQDSPCIYIKPCEIV